jgi:hypothetical protein
VVEVEDEFEVEDTPDDDEFEVALLDEGVVELENVINPNALIAVTRTNPRRNHNQKAFFLFLSFSSSSLRIIFLSSFMVNVPFLSC